MIIDHMPTLNREIKRIINQQNSEIFPVVIHFNEGMECPQFKITVEMFETDTYIDSLGQKWKRIK